MGLLQLVTGIGRSRAAKAAGRHKEPRIDDDLPLGLHIGSTIKIFEGTVALLMAEFPDLAVSLPAEVLFVLQYGRAEDAGFVVHRFYMSTNSQETEPEYLLQVVANGNEIAEVNFWQQIDEVCPRTESEQAAWLDPSTWAEEDGDRNGIGWPVYTDPDGRRYELEESFALSFREDVAVPENFGNVFVAEPHELKEVVCTDPRGHDSVTYKHQAAQYMRCSSRYDGEKPPKDTRFELVFLTYVTDRDQNGAVEVWRGIDLAKGDFEVI